MPLAGHTAQGFFLQSLQSIAYLALFCILFVLYSPFSSLAQSRLINGDLVVIGHYNYCDAAGSTGDAYACNLSQTLTAYVEGTHYLFKASADNVGAATLNLNGAGAKTIVKQVAGGMTTTLADGDIKSGEYVLVVYDGTNMRLLSASPQMVALNTGNTWTTGAQDMGSATSFKVPTSAGAGPTTSGLLAYDSTSNTWEGGVNGSNAIFQTSLTSVVKSVFIPAASFEVSGSCAQNASAVLVTNGPKLPTVTCTDNDADGVEFDVKMPGNWNASTIQIELDAFSIGNNNTEVLELDWAGQCVRSGDTPAAHSTTGEQPTTITWGNAANREQFATSSAITLNGTCAAGSHLYIRGQVDATATTMSPMTDLKIVGVRLLYTTVGVDQ